ncbi:MAG: transporter substrate-binding domain-containing protein, partial [Cytophagales bacterium]|nr:transporter substrate-binding domain-containing protein [Cytophagales bacterium]
FPGGAKDESYKGYTFVTPQYAIWYTKGIAVLFKKSTISNWNGINSLKGKSIVSARGSNHIRELEKYGEKLSSEIKNAYEHRTPEGALKIVMADRIDVYISSIELMEVALNAQKKAFNAAEYQIEFLGRQKFYPLFQHTERGKQLAEIFDKGMRQFYQSGHLTTWFKESPYAAFENIDTELMKK